MSKTKTTHYLIFISPRGNRKTHDCFQFSSPWCVIYANMGTHICYQSVTNLKEVVYKGQLMVFSTVAGLVAILYHQFEVIFGNFLL